MSPQLISIEAMNYLFMHLLGSHRADGMLFLVRRGGQFALLPYFPGQGACLPEADLRTYQELVETIFNLMGEGWEVVGRLQLDYLAVRTGAPFWHETIALATSLCDAA